MMEPVCMICFPSIVTRMRDELMKTCEVYREIYFSQFPEERAAYNNESGVIA